jgi:hypothetical protein
LRTSERDRLAARELGLALAQLKRLKALLPDERNPEALLSHAYDIEQDQEGRALWQVYVGGTLTAVDGGLIQFTIQFNINGRDLLWGSSRVPDWFKVTSSSGEVLFEGEVEHPDNEDDAPGWARYEVFRYVRMMGFYGVIVTLLTGRPVVELEP